jgi:large subunit ribosomal protein L4
MGSKTKRKRIKARAAGQGSRARAKVDAAKETGPKEFSIPVFNAEGQEVEKFSFNKKVFTGVVNKGVLYQAVRMYNANRRQGNASTKTRGDVSGGGKKPWRQKGTGRARAGSTRSPLWRHGGVVFGPHPRDYHYSVPKKVKRLALLSSINSKLNESRVIGMDAVKVNEPKTKMFRAILDALKLKGSSLFVVETVDMNTIRASRNLGGVSIKNFKDINTMDILNSDNVVMSRAALEKLPERFKDTV